VRIWSRAVVMGALLAANSPYGSEPGNESDASAATPAIGSEQPGLADVFGEVDGDCNTGWCGYFEDPNKTFLSYAVVRVGASLTCTGAFIGPNLLMTASHCGGPTAVPVSMTYLASSRARPGSHMLSQWNIGTCDGLLGAIQQDLAPVWYRGAADVQLFYCPAVNVRGDLIAPGLLLGDLDFDLRDVQVGEPVFRLWWNPVADRGNQNNLLISQSTITNVSGYYGFQNTPAYSDNTCSNKGASGSPGLSPTWLRILIGPLDSGAGPLPSQPCAPGARGAKAHSIFETFYLDPGLYGTLQINEPNIASRGLSPKMYWGAQDRNSNYVLDLQEDMEYTRGEINRSYYWYNFDSRRRNALWRQFAQTQTFADHVTPPGPPFGIVHLASTFQHSDARAYTETLYRHDTFPISPNSTYRVSFKLLRVDEAASAQSLRFAGPSTPGAPISTPVSQVPRRVAFRFNTGATVKPGIRFHALDRVRADIQTLSIVKETALKHVMGFDNVDERQSWRNLNTSGRALFLPDGKQVAMNTPPDWALAITRDAKVPITNDWSALNEHMAFAPTDTYSICFDARSSSLNLNGRAEAVDGATGNVLASVTMSTIPTWANYCLTPFTAQSSTLVRIGIRTQTQEHILIDNLSVTRVLR
jgi:hypothetical protein